MKISHLMSWFAGLVCLLTVTELLAIVELLGQAGGGGSFGGGGSSGGGGGGGGGDGAGYLFYLLIRLAIDKPLIGIPVIVAVLVVAYKLGYFGHQSRTIRRGAPLRRTHKTRHLVATLQESDPSFDASAFLGRVGVAFQQAQDSWCKQELEPLRAFVSDGIFERFSLQIEEQRDDGWRQGMTDTTIGDLQLVHVAADPHFDTVTVVIPFTSRIHRLALDSGKKIRGSDLPVRQFEECWSFIRRRGATTIDGKGLIEGHCPNCATPIELNATAKCESCQSLLRSGEYDWVLAEITQASEWQGEDTSVVPGLAAMQKGDPGLNIQHLEDRASVMFWRKVAADRRGSIDPLAKVASTEFLRDHATDFEASEDGTRVYIGDCAVGSVKTVGLLPGVQWDRAVIEFRWDGRYVRVEDGKRSVDGDRRLRSSYYVLSRRCGAITDVGQAVSSSHCPTCGAPDEGGTGHACDYCGAVLNSGSGEWILTGIYGASSTEGRNLRQEVRTLDTPAGSRSGASIPSNRAVLHWAVQTAMADGDVTPKEDRALARLGKKLGVNPERLATLRESIRADASETPEPSNTAEARNWLDTMITLALADGKVSAAENRLLSHAAGKAGYSRHDLTRLIKNRRQALYKESRVELRAARRL